MPAVVEWLAIQYCMSKNVTQLRSSRRHELLFRFLIARQLCHYSNDLPEVCNVWIPEVAEVEYGIYCIHEIPLEDNVNQILN